MAVIPFFRLICRPDPEDTLLQSARPLFPQYVGTDRAHAAQTIYLVGSALGMAKTYQDSAERVFEREIRRLQEHLQDAADSGAYGLARWAFHLDDDDAADGINRCVQPPQWQERKARVLEAINIGHHPNQVRFQTE